jgi:hypothetical protein
VTGVWVGAQDPTVRFTSTAMGQGANTGLPIYGYYMKKNYADAGLHLSKSDFAKPQAYRSGVVQGDEAVDFGIDDNLFESDDDSLPAMKGKAPVETQEVMSGGADSTGYE